MPSLSQNQLDWCLAALRKDRSAQATIEKEVKIEDVSPLRVEASHRHFYRLTTNQGNWVFMYSPPELENNQAFVSVADQFLSAKVPVPEIRAHDLKYGWVLMSDLGTLHLADVYGTDLEDPALNAAITELIPLSQIEGLPTYTAQRMWDELAIFSDWFVQEFLQEPVNGTLQEPFDRLVDATQMQPQSCIHRDYHSRNLLFQDNKLGVVDFQDALHGPVLYDIASLLRDCYYEFSEDVVQRWLTMFHQNQPLLADATTTQVWDWFNFTAMQRQLKAVGIFARLHLRDAKSSHLPHILPVLIRLERLMAQYPELNALQASVSEYIDKARTLKVLNTMPGSTA